MIRSPVVDVEAPSPPDPRVGNVLQGRYRILSKIASGAMGVVYQGERVQLGRPVAVKFLHPWIAAQKAFLSRFENEAKAMSRLAHPHCVSVIDFGIEGAPYLVMDFVTGRTLREVMLSGPIALPRVFKIASQLLAGLAHAHAQVIVHRDLKPENLILSGEGGLEEHLRILDFGLAKLRDGPAMTAGMAVGTPSYMSPEQSGGGGAVDARTDLYAVGVVLFEILAGRKPFQSENVGELIFMHRDAPPPLLREVAPEAGYSKELESLLGKALSKLPENRFQSAGEFAAALAATPEAQGGARPNLAPSPAPSGSPAKAPAARVPAKTTVDTVSAVRRRLGGEAAGVPADVVPGAPAPGHRRTAWMVLGGFVLVVMVALSLGRGLRRKVGEPADVTTAGGSHASSRVAELASAPSSGPHGTANVAPSEPRAPAVEDPRIEQARQLVAAGQSPKAIELLDQLRAEKPADADAPYLLATIYFDQRRWSEGLGAAQTAVRLNPELKTDGDLIRGAIRSLVSDRGYQRAQTFLRSLGAPAVPFIKEAARRDPDARIRQRASELLDGGRGGGSSSWSGGGRQASSSMFKR
ncbi:MAG TPA: serine/threonine-protein kinase [Polyangia bacterium]|nr:serine/threonine-protein kinase [Polyangia bacterium]